MINKKYTKGLLAGRQGFTLVETLVAVVILSIAITGPLMIAQKGLQIALISKDQDTAYYLAQDAIEYIRYARDTNCLQTSGGAGGCQAVGQWLAGNGNATQTINLFTPCVSTGGTSACTVDVIAGNSVWPPTTCGGSTCTTPINYDSTYNYFTYTSGSPSIFTRTITIQNDPNGTSPNEAAIIVTVTWKDPLTHTITVKENLLDWQ